MISLCKKYFLILFVTLFSLNVNAQSIKLKENHPTKYIVEKGDTLWDISDSFLKNPWQWSEIWDLNGDIKNPHLIYPGDIIYLSYVDGQPRLSVKKLNGTVDLRPKVRLSSIEQAINVIPLKKIKKFLTSPKVVTEDELSKSPYIIDFVDAHLIVSEKDGIFVKNIKDIHSDYFIYKSGDPYIDPFTRKVLGYQAVYLGEANLVNYDEISRLKITKSLLSINKGNRLLKKDSLNYDLNFHPTSPESDVDATIIASLSDSSNLGQFDSVVINKGLSDGLKTGNILDIYRIGALVEDDYISDENKKEKPFNWKFWKKDLTKLPDTKNGIILIYRVFDNVSYGLILKATKSISVNNAARSPS